MRKISYRSGCCFIVALCLMLSSGVSLAASLNLSKTSSASAALVGDVIAFTLTATNTTTSALSNVVLTDALPAGMAYSTHAAPPDTLVSVAGNAVTWSLPSLAANSSAQMTLVVLLTAKGAYTNVVTAPGTASASANILVLDKAVTHYNFDQVPGSLTGAVGEVKDVGTTGLNGRRVLTSGSSIVSNIVSPNPTIAAQNPTVNGGFCNAIRLDGTAVVQVPHSPLFRYENEFSASVWIYATQYPTSSNQYASILSNDQNYEFHLDQNGKLYWWWGADNFTSNTKIALNTWTHVAITFNSAVSPGRQRIYINGVQDSSTKSWGGKLAENPCNFYLGGDVATGSCALIPGRNFVGMIDEAKLYPKELSATEVRADMLLGRSCTNTFDHLQIEHDGAASTCTPETVTIKACQNASCSTLYTDPVTTTLIPSGWVGGDSFTFSGGITTRQLSKTSTGSVNLGSSSPYTCSTGSGTSCALNFVSTSCNFDAVEPTAAPGARLYTKLTGVEFKVDVLALNATKAINTGYAGTVNVDLVDTSSVACPTGTGLTTPAQSLTFATIDKGRKPILFTYPKAARNVSVRMRVGSGAPACSSDNFTIRPQAITSITTTTVNADPTGVSANASALKAGSAFDLMANTNTAGYDDKPKLDPSRVEWELAKRPVDGRADPGGGLVEGEFAVAASAGTGNGAQGSAFKYQDVGYFRFQPRGVYDDSFTSYSNDLASGDCINAPGDDFSNALIAGKYGCKFGNPTVSGYFGRFKPDHFELSNASVVNRADLSCNPGSGFSYMNEDMLAKFTLTAKSVSGATAENYAGTTWAKLNLGTPSSFELTAIDRFPTAWARNIVQVTGNNPITITTATAHGYANNDLVVIHDVRGMAEINTNKQRIVTVLDAIRFSVNLDLPATGVYRGGGIVKKKNSATTPPAVFIPNGRLSVLSSGGAWRHGVAADIPLRFQFLRPAASPDGSFQPEFGIAPKDSEGTEISPYDTRMNAGVGANDRASGGMMTSVRFGRLKLSNAHGSDRVNLTIPLVAQYWNLGAWIANTMDNCSVIPASSVVLGNYTKNLNSTNMPTTNVSGFGAPLKEGQINPLIPGSGLKVVAPNASGSVDLALNLGSGSGDQFCQASLGTSAGAALGYLRSSWCDSSYARDPRARLTFGVFKNTGEFIYLRELY